MKWSNCIFLGVVAWLGVGCSIKRIHDDPRYFGGFRTDIQYVTQFETIVTDDKPLYHSPFYSPARLYLVAAGSRGAINSTQGKFIKRRERRVSEIARLPVGTRVKFVGVEVVSHTSETLGDALPYVQILDGPYQGKEACAFYLCSGISAMVTVSKGGEVRVFSPRELFLLPVERPR